jgi:hypothetical protein
VELPLRTRQAASRLKGETRLLAARSGAFLLPMHRLHVGPRGIVSGPSGFEGPGRRVRQEPIQVSTPVKQFLSGPCHGDRTSRCAELPKQPSANAQVIAGLAGSENSTFHHKRLQVVTTELSQSNRLDCACPQCMARNKRGCRSSASPSDRKRGRQTTAQARQVTRPDKRWRIVAPKSCASALGQVRQGRREIAGDRVAGRVAVAGDVTERSESVLSGNL